MSEVTRSVEDVSKKPIAWRHPMSETLVEQFSPEDTEALISTAGELYANALDAHDYLSVQQQGLLTKVLEGQVDFTEIETESLLHSAGELYNNSHEAEEFLSIRQQGLASLALQKLEELHES